MVGGNRMTILSLIKRIPSYASDVKINLNACFENMPKGMNHARVRGAAVTAGYWFKNEELLNDIRAEAKLYLEDSDAMACKLSIINCSAHARINAYEAALHSADSSSKPLNKSMSFSMPGSIKVDKVDYMMYCLVASILFRCKTSIKHYTDELRKEKISQECLDFLAKLTATLCSVYETLEIETLRSYDFITRESSF